MIISNTVLSSSLLSVFSFVIIAILTLWIQPKNMRETTGKKDKIEAEDYKIFRDYVQHEDSLINNRLTWFLVSQGFIFSAYTISIRTMANITIKSAEICYKNDSHSENYLCQTISNISSSLDILNGTLKFFGLITSILVFLSIIGANIAISILKKKLNSHLAPRKVDMRSDT